VVLERDWVLFDIMVNQDTVEWWWKNECSAQKHPHQFFSYSEAVIQSRVSIMLVESRKLEHYDRVVTGISLYIIRFLIIFFSRDILYKNEDYV
jgi:hypothetical protein